jgi:ribosome biogenesis GTPase
MSTALGLVVARYRRHVTVEDPQGERHICQIQKRSLDPIVGDQVEWVAATEGGTLAAIQPRSSTLQRIDKRGRPEPVAANLTQLLTVIAPEPAPDWLLLDRYLAAAELAGIAAIIVFNKMDLCTAPPEELQIYRAAGYEVHATSARRAEGLTELALLMRGQRSVLVGQSGAGKSSLINALLGSAAQSVGALTTKGGQGRHTTSTAVLYRLPTGGELVDSPGVRDFAPYIAAPAQIENGFREFRTYLGKCKFDDCQHLAEPDCAIKDAVAGGAISARRYESYRRLYALTRELIESRAY